MKRPVPGEDYASLRRGSQGGGYAIFAHWSEFYAVAKLNTPHAGIGRTMNIRDGHFSVQVPFATNPSTVCSNAIIEAGLVRTTKITTKYHRVTS